MTTRTRWGDTAVLALCGIFCIGMDWGGMGRPTKVWCPLSAAHWGYRTSGQATSFHRCTW